MLKEKFTHLSRKQKQIIMILSDVFILLFSIWLSFALRLGEFWSDRLYMNQWIFILIPIVSIPLFIRLGLYRSVLKFMGTKVIVTAFQSITITSLIVGFTMMIFREADMPRTVILIFWFVSSILIIIMRFLYKGYLYSWDNFVNDRKPTIIFGAGSAGAQIVESLRKNHEYAPIAFIDDDKSKQGTFINFTRIHPFSDLKDIIKKRKVRVILLAIPSLSEQRKRDLLKKLSKYPVEVKLLPSLSEIVSGRVSMESIRHVQVEDILGRTPVKPKTSLLKKNITSKNVLVTGAGGSIGSELCRQILELKPSKIVLFEHSEFNLYSIDYELTSLAEKDCEIIPVLADVKSINKVDNAIKENNIDTIYHAAAYKHVPMVEKNTVEGVFNNVMGTYNVAVCARDNNVENMVLISTDKAVRPTNVMGASKRFSELVLQALNSEKSNTCFSMVRFGNVLDSAGSVVPLFRRQIKEGGPVTVTHSKVTRYFMSIPEAVQLVLQAGAMAKGGDVFVLDMGEPVRILDLAHRMINLSGLSPITSENPEGDIKIKFTGLREGEKLYEELLIGKDVTQSKHPQIMQANEDFLSWQKVSSLIEEIKTIHENLDDKSMRKVLIENVEGYKPAKH
ncbi:MAG: polysaccharide biosynthesis protein [Flavobacteriales bacterium]|nr:polysaccharide biosynthesis protein [Flavobacteriales bacterium]